MDNALKEATDINVAYENYENNPTVVNYEQIFLSANRLIEKFVSGAFNKQKSRDDLIQSGYLGLTKAIKSYKSNLGTKFSTWASTCIISEIRHEVRREQKFFNIKTGEDEALGGLLSLTSDDGKSMLEQKNDVSTEIVESESLDLKFILENLSEIDREIVELLFFKDMSQDEVAARLNISQKKVSRQKAKIISLIQLEMNEKPVDFKLIDNSKSFVRQPSPLDHKTIDILGKKNDDEQKDLEKNETKDFKIIDNHESFKLLK